MFLTGRGYDVRDVWPTARRGLTALANAASPTCWTDSERIARETLAHPLLPKAFKRAGQDQGLDEHHQLLACGITAVVRS